MYARAQNVRVRVRVRVRITFVYFITVTRGPSGGRFAAKTNLRMRRKVRVVTSMLKRG